MGTSRGVLSPSSNTAPGLAFFVMENELSESLGRTVDLNTSHVLSSFLRDGEPAAKVSPDARAKRLAIRWSKIIGMRNRPLKSAPRRRRTRAGSLRPCAGPVREDSDRTTSRRRRRRASAESKAPIPAPNLHLVLAGDGIAHHVGDDGALVLLGEGLVESRFHFGGDAA